VTGAIAIDGNLDDEGWRGATPIDTWYETNPGDNTPPKVKSVAYLGYDDKYFYAAFRFEDPNPKGIRAPVGDRDNVPPSTDYAGVILDTRHDRRSAILFLSNARGIQYDAVQDDATGNEDSSPDFYWDSAAKVTAEGWNLEIRIPFSSLRYPKREPQTWGSCCTGTILATSATRCSRPGCPAGATASSASRTPSRVSRAFPPAGTWCWHPMRAAAARTSPRGIPAPPSTTARRKATWVST
jgi:hypothetical protein